jgi:hypothetical protein
MSIVFFVIWTKSNLHTHIRKFHKNLKQFGYDIYVKQHLKKIDSLNIHIKTPHENLKLLVCHICSARFVLECNLNTHLLADHKHITKSQCRIYPSICRLRAILIRHVLATHKT